MSRVYNVLTGAGRPAGPASPEPPDDGVWGNEDDAPFVEIGGPSGPVFSAASAPTSPTAAKVEAARSYPRLAPTPAPTAATYLSVRFHDLAPPGSAKPNGGPDASLVAYHHPDHPVSTEYRTVRDVIRGQLPGSASRALLFLAAAPEAGTTTVLLNLAVTLASDGRVLVVDANLARPAAAPRLGLRRCPGLSEVLGQHAPLAWAVQPTAIPGLQLLAAGEVTETTPRAMSQDFPRLLNQVRQWYDWILVDGGVSQELPVVAGPVSDAVYLVTRDSDAGRPEFATLRSRVKELGGTLRGYVATRV